MTEKNGLEKTVVFNLKSANESDVNNIVNEKGHESRSFYYKLGLLYFLNIVDWICTEALIGSGHFVEANPVMQPVLENFWLTLLIKGILPLVLILGCAYSTAKSALFRELLPFQKMSVRDIWNSMPATTRGQMCITSCFPYSTIFRIWKPKFPHLHIRLTTSWEILTSL